MSAREIAARLSPAQRRNLLAMEPRRSWQKAPHNARWSLPIVTLIDLHEKDHRRWRFTTIGLCVRAILAKEENHA